MNINSISNTNFKAKVSEELISELKLQTTNIRNQTRVKKELYNKIQNLAQWGEPETEIVLCKNHDHTKNITIGIKKIISDDISVKIPIIKTSGKTLIGRFLNLTKDSILTAEKSVINLLKKEGLSCFKRYI